MDAYMYTGAFISNDIFFIFYFKTIGSSIVSSLLDKRSYCYLQSDHGLDFEMPRILVVSSA